jgi:hypothetical protein
LTWKPQVKAVYVPVGPCADLNNDGLTNGADLSILLGAWSSGLPVADLNIDGVIDGADLAILLGCWAP